MQGTDMYTVNPEGDNSTNRRQEEPREGVLICISSLQGLITVGCEWKVSDSPDRRKNVFNHAVFTFELKVQQILLCDSSN